MWRKTTAGCFWSMKTRRQSLQLQEEGRLVSGLRSHLCEQNPLLLPYPFPSDICPAAKNERQKSKRLHAILPSIDLLLLLV